MTKKQRKRRPAGDYTLPPHIEESRQRTARIRSRLSRPEPPPLRAIWGIFGTFLLCAAMTLFFWLTAHSVLQDLRSEGVTVAARVIGVDNKPKRVQIRLAQGPASGLEADLGDYAGMYPDVNVGDPMLVTYDPKDIRRSLDQRWVRNPPPNLPAYGASAMSLFFLAGTVVAMLRRHRLVRMHDTATPHPPATPLTKP